MDPWIKISAWYRDGVNRKLAEMQYQLGRMYEGAREDGVAQDQAVVWYRRAAQRDHAPAQFRLGRMHLEGRGVSPNLDEALHWWRRSAALGWSEALDRA